MRDFFKRINPTGFEVNISTFSKPHTHRTQEPFRKFYEQLNQLVPKKEDHKKLHNKYVISPIDSPIITLTSKLYQFPKNILK